MLESTGVFGKKNNSERRVMGAVYRIWNKKNGKSYIGQSNRPYKRIKKHLTPESMGVSKQIQEDLLKYAPEVWNWEIVAEERHYQLWGVTLNELEIENIRKFDTYNNGYNENRGGGVRFSRPTHSEDNLRLNQQKMREEIRHTIGNYQCQKFYGISLQEFLRQREIIAQYGSLEAYERHLERERERQQEEVARQKEEAARRTAEWGFNFGCFCLVALFVLIANLVSNC